MPVVARPPQLARLRHGQRDPPGAQARPPARPRAGGVVAIVLAAGTATTGAGPHAGGSSGQLVAKRLPVALRDMAELHSSVALLLVGVVLSLVVALHAIDVPERVRRTARVFFCVLVAQAAIGYTQYFTHLPALLVELHVIGAVSIAIGTTRFSSASRITHLKRLPSGAAHRTRRRCRRGPPNAVPLTRSPPEQVAAHRQCPVVGW